MPRIASNLPGRAESAPENDAGIGGGAAASVR